MEYPCKTCLIDIVCRKCCKALDKYVEYLDKNKIPIPKRNMRNINRSFRILDAASETNISYSFYEVVVIRSSFWALYNFLKESTPKEQRGSLFKR